MQTSSHRNDPNRPHISSVNLKCQRARRQNRPGALISQRIGQINLQFSFCLQCLAAPSACRRGVCRCGEGVFTDPRRTLQEAFSQSAHFSCCIRKAFKILWFLTLSPPRGTLSRKNVSQITRYREMFAPLLLQTHPPGTLQRRNRSARSTRIAPR